MNSISKENIVETGQYKQGVKKLIKKHKTETLNSLKQIIEDLCNFKITTQYHNHKLTNLDAYELHVNNEGDVLLIYRYSGNALIISLHLIDLTDHKELKNPDHQKQIKKTIKNLKENKGDKNMEYMEYTTTNENILIVGFKFKNKITGADTMFNYEVPFEIFIEAVKDYFDKHFDVVLKGKYKDIWNMLVDLGERVNADIIQEFIEDDEIIKELQDRLKEEAHEKFDEMCEEEVEDEEDGIIKREGFDLPSEITVSLDELGLDTIDDEDEVEETISDYLSDKYGFTHYGFEWERGDSAEEINVYNIKWDTSESLEEDE